tara:strand:- start:3303 stop:5573 length:2271 start_codon:yes stop_codon:yes gene_type:complete
MKNRTVIFGLSFLIPFLLSSQTLYFDEEGVRLSVEITDSGERVSCENDWDRNYTDRPIHVWKITLRFRNGSDKKLKPKLAGVASINVIPSDGKVLDYCGYDRLNHFGIENKGQQLFLYTIFYPEQPNIDAGQTVSSSAYLYLLQGAKPILESWNFLGYDFLDGSPSPKGKAIEISEQARKIMFESIDNDSKQEDIITDDNNYSIPMEERKNSTSISKTIIGEWIKVDGCTNGSSITQKFNEDGTGTVIVPDCNKVCPPYHYRYEFKWSTSGSKLTVDYQSVAKYCDKKAPVPPTDIMDYEVSGNTLRIVQDRYYRSGTTSGQSNSSTNATTNAKTDLAKKIADEYNLEPEHSELLQIIASSNSNDEIKAKLKKKNQELYTEWTMQAINKLLGSGNGEFPISINEITNLSSENLVGPLQDFERNQNIKNLSNVLNEDTELAAGILGTTNAIAGTLETGRKNKEANEINNLLNFLKPRDILTKNNGKASKDIIINANFNDAKWIIPENKLITTEFLSDDEVEIVFKENTRIKELRESDFPFLEFNDPKFSLLNDFTIEFEMGYYTNEMKEAKYGGSVPIGLFVGEHTKFSLGLFASNVSYSFTPIVNNLCRDLFYYNRDMDLLANLLDNRLILTSKKALDLISINNYPYTNKKYWKAHSDSSKPLWRFAKKIRKQKNNSYDEILYIKFIIIKKGELIYIKRVLNFLEETHISYSPEIPFQYASSHKIYFGVSAFNKINFTGRAKEGYKYRIRNFRITQ